jgi:hypothetical protein
MAAAAERTRRGRPGQHPGRRAQTRTPGQAGAEHRLTANRHTNAHRTEGEKTGHSTPPDDYAKAGTDTSQRTPAAPKATRRTRSETPRARANAPAKQPAPRGQEKEKTTTRPEGEREDRRQNRPTKPGEHTRKEPRKETERRATAHPHQAERPATRTGRPGGRPPPPPHNTSVPQNEHPNSTITLRLPYDYPTEKEETEEAEQRTPESPEHPPPRPARRHQPPPKKARSGRARQCGCAETRREIKWRRED